MAVMLEEIAEQIRNGRLGEAEEGLSSVPDDVEGRLEVLFLKGYLREQQYDHEGALEYYEQVLEQDAGHTEALFRAAVLYDLHGADDRAIECYRRCLREEPVPVNALLNLAILYEERGQIDLAAVCVDPVLREYPDHPRARTLKRSISASKTMIFDEKGQRDREARDAVLDTPISEFELSVRSRNCLKQMNITTLGDLLKATEEELLSYKNFGETSLNEIKAMLVQKGLQLGQGVPEPTLAPAPPPSPSSPSSQKLESVQDMSISELELSVRSRKCLQRLGVTTLRELADRTEAELMASKNFGLTSLGEIKRQLARCGLSLKDSK
jgi:DNA-directed RNA polymerase subunit alpha